MSEIIKEFEKIDKFLELARTVDAFEHCHTVYDLFGIKNKNTPYPDIERTIKDFVNKYSGNNAPKYKIFGKSIAAEAVRIETILKNHRREYNDYLRLNDPRVKQIRMHFDFCTKHDGELDSGEKNNLVKEGKNLGFTESDMLVYISEWVLETGVREVESPSGSPELPPDYGGKTYYEILGIDENADYSSIKEAYEREHVKYTNSRNKAQASARFFVVSEAWECLKDPAKRREYDEKLRQPKTPIPTGLPRLVIECKADLTYRDIRRGSVINVDGIVIKNTEGGLLQGTIKSDVSWLEPDRNKILEKHEQELYVNILTSKIPTNTYDATGNITISSNGGVHSIPFNVILEGLDIAVDRFRKSYVPLIAVCAGFIGSLSSSPVSYFFFGAMIVGAISYASAELIVKYLFNEGIDIFKMPPAVIQCAAVVVPILAIMVHSGDNAAVRHYDNPISDPARASAPAPAPASPSINITKAVVAAGADTNNVAFGIDTSFSPGNKTLHYNITYDGGIANQTVFFFKWFKSGNLISESQFTIQYPSGWVDSKLNYDFQPGEYKVEASVAGTVVNTTSFIIVEAPASTPASIPTTVPDTPSIKITKAVVAASVDTNNVPFGIDTSFSPGNKTLHYNLTYDGGIANQTVFFFKWFKSGSLINERQFTLEHPSGVVDNYLSYDFQPGEYEVQSYVNGQQVNRIYFNVKAEDQQYVKKVKKVKLPKLLNEQRMHNNESSNKFDASGL